MRLNPEKLIPYMRDSTVDGLRSVHSLNSINTIIHLHSKCTKQVERKKKDNQKSFTKIKFN